MSTPSVRSSAKEEHHKGRKLYGRKIGRPLTKSAQDVYDALYPGLALDAEFIADSRDLEPQKFFGTKKNEIWFEIGFGDGAHLKILMERNPDVGFLGAEPFINGVANFLKFIQPLPRHNVKILQDDAMLLVRALKNKSLERIYVLNPDPWPKKRHHKRRIINQDNLSEFARVLKPGGSLIMATDVADLADWMVTECMIHPRFTWTANSASDWRNPPQDWASITRYAEKGIAAGRQQVYLNFTSCQ